MEQGHLHLWLELARFEPGRFHLAQFFMRDPSEEIAQLYALEQFLAPCQALVTFNGKAFDAPLLNTRYAINGWPTPIQGLNTLTYYIFLENYGDIVSPAVH